LLQKSSTANNTKQFSVRSFESISTDNEEFLNGGASTPLCRHEVTFLAVRCASFGRWFPVNFPGTNLLRKFHVLTFHVPEKAISKGTVGMEAEHCSESIHPVVNKLDRIYATTQNTCDRLALVAKSQWLQSDSTLTNFKKPSELELPPLRARFAGGKWPSKL